MSFHPGEIAVQTQAGVREEAEGLSSLIKGIISTPAQEFLRSQQLAIATTIAPNGMIWTSLLTGKPEFLQVLNEQILQINCISIKTDLLLENLHDNHDIGLLAIDLATRRRLRLNGKAEIRSDKIEVEIQQAFFNCPKYIQVRHLEQAVTELTREPEISTSDVLSDTNRLWITQADTFFIGSYHPQNGADASHRGGLPGFVEVLTGNKLVFPDYAGNNMFQTLGNLIINPHAGLLFLDFASGCTLQLTGTARVIWDEERLNEFAGAQRLVEFDIEQVRETQNATSWRWQFGQYSPANPKYTSSTI
jgi:hypothetical protein